MIKKVRGKVKIINDFAHILNQIVGRSIFYYLSIFLSLIL